MAERIYDMDNDSDVAALKRRIPMSGALPRQTIYGSPEAVTMGLYPIEDAAPDVLLEPDQYVDAMNEGHELQTMPVYSTFKWRPENEFRWYQDGIGYCWTWSGTGWVMTTRACEDKPLVMLAPVSMGYLVSWQNRGNYLESFIRGAREDGICPAVDGDYNSTNRSSSYWSDHDEDRHKYKIDKIWDTRASDMWRHLHSIFHYGRSCYCAWNRLGHAMEACGIRYVNGDRQLMVSNSHNKLELLIMRGESAKPDEAYGGISTAAV